MTAPLTEAALAAIEARAAKATPGPWTATEHAKFWQLDAAFDAVATTALCFAPETAANAAFIAHARADIPRLLAEVRRLREALAGMVGLVQMLAARDDVSPALRHIMTDNHRFATARAVLGEASNG